MDNILIYAIDDSRFQLEVLNSGFRKYPNRVKFIPFLTFHGLQEAIANEEPDCCIIDLVMPYHPGTEVCKEVRKKHPNIKTFINTYECGEEYKILAEACDAVYLSKTMPFEDRMEVILNACKS